MYVLRTSVCNYTAKVLFHKKTVEICVIAYYYDPGSHNQTKIINPRGSLPLLAVHPLPSNKCRPLQFYRVSCSHCLSRAKVLKSKHLLLKAGTNQSSGNLTVFECMTQVFGFALRKSYFKLYIMQFKLKVESNYLTF